MATQSAGVAWRNESPGIGGASATCTGAPVGDGVVSSVGHGRSSVPGMGLRYAVPVEATRNPQDSYRASARL